MGAGRGGRGARREGLAKFQTFVKTGRNVNSRIDPKKNWDKKITGIRRRRILLVR